MPTSLDLDELLPYDGCGCGQCETHDDPDDVDVYDDPYKVVMYDIDVEGDDLYALLDLLDDSDRSWYAKRRLNALAASGPLSALVADIIIDSLGRRWDPLQHPRDRFGRFIETGGFFRWLMGEVWHRGQVSRIDSDGVIHARSVGNDGVSDGSMFRFKPAQANKLVSIEAPVATLDDVDLDADIPDFPEATDIQKRIYNSLASGDMPAEDLDRALRGDFDLSVGDFTGEINGLRDRGLIEIESGDKPRVRRADNDGLGVRDVGDDEIADVPEGETPELADSPALTKQQRDLLDFIAEVDRGEGDGVLFEELESADKADIEALVEAGALVRGDGDRLHLENPEPTDVPEGDAPEADVGQEIFEAANAVSDDPDVQEAFQHYAEELARPGDENNIPLPEGLPAAKQRNAESAARKWWEERGGETLDDSEAIPEPEASEVAQQNPKEVLNSRNQAMADQLVEKFFPGEEWLDDAAGVEYRGAIKRLFDAADLDENGFDVQAEAERDKAQRALRRLEVPDQEFGEWMVEVNDARGAGEVAPDGDPDLEALLPAEEEDALDESAPDLPEPDGVGRQLDEGVDEFLAEDRTPTNDEVSQAIAQRDSEGEFDAEAIADVDLDHLPQWVAWQKRFEDERDLDGDINDALVLETALAKEMGIDLFAGNGLVNWNSFVQGVDLDVADKLYNKHGGAIGPAAMDYVMNREEWDAPDAPEAPEAPDVEVPEAPGDLIAQFPGEAKRVRDAMFEAQEGNIEPLEAYDIAARAVNEGHLRQADLELLQDSVQRDLGDGWDPARAIDYVGDDQFGQMAEIRQQAQNIVDDAVERQARPRPDDSAEKNRVRQGEDLEAPDPTADRVPVGPEGQALQDLPPDFPPTPVPDDAVVPAKDTPEHAKAVNQPDQPNPADLPNLTVNAADPKDRNGRTARVGQWYRAGAGGEGDPGELVAFYDQDKYPNWVVLKMPDGKLKGANLQGKGRDAGLNRIAKPSDDELQARRVQRAVKDVGFGEVELDQFNQMNVLRDGVPAQVGMRVVSDSGGQKFPRGEEGVIVRFGWSDKWNRPIVYVIRPGAGGQRDEIQMAPKSLRMKSETPLPPTPEPVAPQAPRVDLANLPVREWQVPSDDELVDKVRGAGDVDMVNFANAHVQPGVVYDQIQGLVDAGRLEVVEGNGGRPMFRVPGDADAVDAPEGGELLSDLPRGANNAVEGGIIKAIDEAGETGLRRADLVDIDDDDAADKLNALKELVDRGVLRAVDDPDGGKPIYRRPAVGGSVPVQMNDAEALEALKNGVDPFSIVNPNMTRIMRDAGYQFVAHQNAGISPNNWAFSPEAGPFPVKVPGYGAQSGHVYMVKSTSTRISNDVMNEVMASVLSEGALASAGRDAPGLLYHPKVSFASFPTGIGKGAGGKIIMDHAAYGYPEGHEFYDGHGIRRESLRDAGATGNVVSLALYDYIINNAVDRHNGNQMYVKDPATGQIRVVVIDNGYGFGAAQRSGFPPGMDFADFADNSYMTKDLLRKADVRDIAEARQAVQDFLDAYSGFNVDDAMSKIRAMFPGISAEQQAYVKTWLTETKERIDRLALDIDGVADKVVRV